MYACLTAISSLPYHCHVCRDCSIKCYQFLLSWRSRKMNSTADWQYKEISQKPAVSQCEWAREQAVLLTMFYSFCVDLLPTECTLSYITSVTMNEQCYMGFHSKTSLLQADNSWCMQVNALIFNASELQLATCFVKSVPRDTKNFHNTLQTLVTFPLIFLSKLAKSSGNFTQSIIIIIITTIPLTLTFAT